jgi:anti-sigma regulatory factor (Ser/Thr protein kinase)
MHPYATTDPQPAPTRPEAAPGAAASLLPVRSQRARPGPARQDTSRMLGPRDTAPADARATLKLTLSIWGLTHVSPEAETVLTELLTNAITASRASAPEGTDPRPVSFRLTADDHKLRIEVWDPDDTPPPPDASLPGDEEENGRGLFIVAALSTQWGSRPGRNGGKVVWSALSLATPPPGDGAPASGAGHGGLVPPEPPEGRE